MIVRVLFTWVIASAAVVAQGAAPDYERDIAPLLHKYCVACHEGAEAEKGLALDSFAATMKGNKSGAVVVASKSDASKLLLVLDGRGKPAMPPKNNPAPSQQEIATIKAWIDAGATGPSKTAAVTRELSTPKVPLQAPPRRSITAAAVAPDGKSIALGQYGKVRLLDATTRGLRRTLSPIRGSVTAVSFSRGGELILTAAGEPGLFGEAQLWNAADGKLLRTINAHRDSLYAAALSPDGSTLATGSYDQQIKLWNVADGRERLTITGHNGAIYDLAFHPQGHILASASADRTVKLWNVATGARLDTLSQSLKEINAVVFSPDGQRLLAAGADNRIRVWKLSPSAAENTNPILLARFAHEGAIQRLAFSPHGKLLVSSAEDRTVKIWDAEQLVERHVLTNQSDWVAALAFAPDNKTLLLGRLDETYALVDVSTGAEIKPAKPELTSLAPRGIQRGAATKLLLQGKSLVDITQVKLTQAGKAVTAQLRLDPQGTGLAVEITPAAQLARGVYQLTVVGSGGESNALALSIDDLPQLAEHEPNNTTALAQELSLPSGVWGVVQQRGDVDQFRLRLRKGDTAVLELSAKPLNSQLNGQLVLVDGDGQVVASNNDFDGQSDPLLAYTAAADGTYTVRVQDLTFQGGDDFFYRLSVGTFPFVTGVFPLSVSSGRESTVELLGYNLPPQSIVRVKPTIPGEFSVPLDLARYRTSRELKLLATPAEESIEQEPNDQPRQATQLATLSAGGSIAVGGRIAAPQAGLGDVDLYRFHAQAGQVLLLETTAAQRGSPADTKLEILHADGKPVERLLLQAVRDSYVTFRPVTSDVSDIRVQNWEEMELNELLYFQGEVAKVFRMPQGPDSGIQFYTSGGKRRGYFDTSSTAHALDEACYVVEPHPIGTKLLPNGLPVFTLNYVNDDDAERTRGSDSRLLFTAQATGDYLVRVSDSRGFGGDRFVYRLELHEARPDFRVQLANPTPTVNAGGGAILTLRAERIDGFDGDIRIDVEGLPAGWSVSTPMTIQAGHQEARLVINALDEPQADWSQAKLTATAHVGKEQLVHEVGKLGPVKLAAAAKLRLLIEPAELTLTPGSTITATLKVDRQGFDDRVPISVLNLPHGVIVDNIGLNGVLIPEKQTERTIFLKAAPWMTDTDRYFFAESINTRGGEVNNQASRPVLLKVRRGGAVAQTMK